MDNWNLPDNKPLLIILIQGLMLVLFASIPICACCVVIIYGFYYPENASWFDSSIMVLSLLLLGCFIYYLSRLKIKHNRLKWLSFIVLNILMLISLFSFDTQPCSDYKALFNMAKLMANNQYIISHFHEWDYEYMINYQTGMAAFESLLIRLWGPIFWPFKVLNFILINILAFLTLKVSRILIGEMTSCWTLLLFCTFYPIIITVNQFSNQQIVAIVILVVLKLINKDIWYRWLLAGILIAIMNVLRPSGILLILTGATITLLKLIFKSRPNYNPKKLILNLVILVTFSYGGIYCFDHLFIRLGYADSPISQRKLTYFKIDRGLTGYDFPDVLNNGNGKIDTFNEWEKHKIDSIWKNEPMTIISFVVRKMIRFQGEFDWKFEHTYNHDEANYNYYPVKGFVMFGWAQYILAAILAFYGYWKWRKTNCIDVFQIFYIGLILAHFFVEAVSTYRFEIYPILLIFAGYGLSIVISQHTITTTIASKDS